ncbi:MAG: hypothetical protein IPM92_04170 [Saprospiraceae bacterium]|nr:hypothetical protein [Saprospiraceae bacterium]
MVLIGVISCGDGSLADPEKIQIDRTQNMNLRSYAFKIEGAYHSPVSFALDIDKNGISDFQFTSNIWGSPAIGQHPEADISCLNNLAFIYVATISDTAFLFTKSDTNYQGKVNIILKNTYSCKRISPTDSIRSIINSKHIKVLARFDEIRNSGPWLSGKLDLNNENYTPPAQNVYNSLDTSVYKVVSYNYDCHSFPDDRIAYIGIKLIDNGAAKLGWIKLSITDKYIISILETAIQN